MNKNERIKWATAIAKRISDEWDGSLQFPEDATLIREYLQKTLSKDGDAIKLFIGTGIIESDYFKNV